MRRRFLNNINKSILDNYSKYFTIEALEDGLKALLRTNACEFSIDNGSWYHLYANNYTPPINKGQTISFKGSLIPNSINGIGTFTISNKCNLKGNIMSLLYGDDFIEQNDLSGKECAFYRLFYSCSTIIDASKLILPATTLATECYSYMFSSCTSLVNAPELPATTLVDYCYSGMFIGCTKLNYIKALFTTTPSISYTGSWVLGVSSTGTFVKSKDATWNVTGDNGIPSGWTVQTV